MKRKPIKITAGIIVALSLIIIGYFKSDNVFYNNVLTSQKLTSPEMVFNWAIKNYNVARSQLVQPYVTSKYLMTNHKFLYCDEAAIMMATLDHNLGYKTRLIDLYGYDNISHHTILQVLEKSIWINYDFTNRLYNKSVNESSNGCNFKLKVARVKPYPRLYNVFINNNNFIKYIAFSIRGIKEN
jgi:hypothetical protein